MTLAEAGIVLGAGTVLAARGTDRSGRATFAIGGCGERILALLAVAHGQAVAPESMGHIRRACRYYADGETCLAMIPLAHASPPRSDDPEKLAYRVFLADALLADGVPARELLTAFDIDPSFLDRTDKRFNVNEPRIPAGNGDESGEWTVDYGSNVVPVAARQIPDEYRTGDPDKFFDTVYAPFHALAQRLGIDETWLLGLAAHESGYLNGHDRKLNDPFGVTHGGGPNVHYNSIDDAVAYWEHHFGPIVRGASTAEEFVHRLFAAGYNTIDPSWATNVRKAIRSIPRRLSTWRVRRGEI
jgi:hypothetical protein